MPCSTAFSAPERTFMLELARRTLVSVVTNNALPEVDTGGLTPKLAEKRACFVTLTRAGSLRGCIGNVLPQAPLYQAVIENTRNAAMRDPRFPSVQPCELDQLKIEISVLTEPKPLEFGSPEELVSKLRPHEDGVLLKLDYQVATFLPQVWAQIPDKVDFLNHLSEKAGCAAGAWREKGTEVSIYHVECFEEAEGANASG
jgi:AmmeMemoRadiSam system protein A